MSIHVKRAFVLADVMKMAQSCQTEESFLALLKRKKLRVDMLPESRLNRIIGRDADRLRRFDECAWVLRDVPIDECLVYPGMGGRPWARGAVGDVADIFCSKEPADSRIWRMKSFAEIYRMSLPIIVLEQGSLLSIDDGSHRAVAMRLCGIETAKAYVGRGDLTT